LVLVSSLLLLLVVTILAVTMFRSFGIQSKIAGNIREKERATHAAEQAQQYAEWWLSNNSASVPVACNALLSANLNEGQICSNTPALSFDVTSVATVPWQIAGNDVGVTYTPAGMNVQPVNPVADSYSQQPRFYVSDLGLGADGLGEVYEIDSVGYGGNVNVPTVSVVRSTYEITPGVINRGGP
jgi:type IV pilus assembly protein PilX